MPINRALGEACFRRNGVQRRALIAQPYEHPLGRIKQQAAQLKSEGEANFRSMAQEVMARIERTFALDDQMTTEAVNKLIDESISSGPEEKFSLEKFDAAIASARSQHAAKGKAR